MKIIFLDIDGVLCTDRSHMAYKGPRSSYMQHLDPVGVKLVESLQEETGAEIVISSSWSEFHDMQSMLAILMNAGFSFPNFHNNWKTIKNHKYSNRGEEIAMWEKMHGTPESYVIIDDDDRLLERQKPYWIECNMNDGLSYAGYKKALKILLGVNKSEAIL